MVCQAVEWIRVILEREYINEIVGCMKIKEIFDNLSDA